MIFFFLSFVPKNYDILTLLSTFSLFEAETQVFERLKKLKLQRNDRILRCQRAQQQNLEIKMWDRRNRIAT